MSHYDVIIVGGGIVGATVALALAQKTSLQVALVDATTLSSDWAETKYAHRVSAISLASQRIFQNLHVWDAIQAKRVSPYKKMHVWDSQGNGELHFNCANINALVLGHIIEDDVIRSSLMKAIVASSVEVISPLRFVSLQEKSDCIELTAEPNRILQAKLVIAADGALSWIRDQAGIELKQRDYGHQAIVATVQTELSHQFTAWQRFLPTGPLAFLPLVDENQSSIVWSTSQVKAEELLALDDDAFQQELTESFEGKLGRVIATGSRYHFNLTMRHAKKYVQSRLALVGDAAHTVHPLAGQGVNLGLLDAACLVEVIADAWSKNRDFTSEATLRRYERGRKSDNATMLLFVEAIQKLFASESVPMQRVRNAGLSLTNQMHFIKNFFANYAAGNRSDMPTLAK